MKFVNEQGVLDTSERYFSTPSTLARAAFFYTTRCGHYYTDETWEFRDTHPIGREPSQWNFMVDYLVKGSMHAEYEDRAVEVTTGQVLLSDCRKPYYFKAKEPLERIWFHFDGANSEAFFHEIIAFHDGKQAFTPYPESHIEAQLMDLISSLKSDSYTEAGYSKKINSLLTDLLIPPITTASNMHGLPSEPISAALQYMREHLFEDISVQTVADAVGVSTSHFSRTFHAKTGFSPHEFIVLNRIDEAKALLKGTNLSVQEIALRTGYHSEVNFISSFKKKTGYSPSAFRNAPL